MSFLSCVAGLKDRVRSSDIQKELRVEPLLFYLEKNHLRQIEYLIRMPYGCLSLEVFQQGGDPGVDPEHAGVITHPIWPGYVLGYPKRRWRTWFGRRTSVLPSATVTLTWMSIQNWMDIWVDPAEYACLYICSLEILYFLSLFLIQHFCFKMYLTFRCLKQPGITLQEKFVSNVLLDNLDRNANIGQFCKILDFFHFLNSYFIHFLLMATTLWLWLGKHQGLGCKVQSKYVEKVRQLKYLMYKILQFMMI